MAYSDIIFVHNKLLSYTPLRINSQKFRQLMYYIFIPASKCIVAIY